MTAHDDLRSGPDLAGPSDRLIDVDPSRTASVRLRSTFTLTSRRSAEGHEQHLITAPKHGPDRAQARRAIIDVLRRADLQHHRVSFVMTLGNYNQHSIGSPHGYEANMVLLHCRMQQDDPYVWLQHQIKGADGLGDSNAIIGVCVNSWPATHPSSNIVVR